MYTQLAETMSTLRRERRSVTRFVHLDRRSGDDDLVEHVIGGVRRSYGSVNDDTSRPGAWACPVCTDVVQHSREHKRPYTNLVYRCPRCRIDLVYSSEGDHLVVGPESYSGAYGRLRVS